MSDGSPICFTEDVGMDESIRKHGRNGNGNIWKHGSFLSWPLKLDLRSGRNAISTLYPIPAYLPMQ